MPEIFFDIYMHMNYAAFVIAIAEKMLRGLVSRRKLSRVFWASVLAFGGLGSMLGCMLSRNHTDDYRYYVITFLTLLQIQVIGLLGRVF